MVNKILVVSETFWPEGGGADLATYLILKLLRDAGFKITVLTGTSNPILLKNVDYYYTKLLKGKNRIEMFIHANLLAKNKTFIKLLNTHDILYIPRLAYPLIPISKKQGLKVIVHLHDYTPIRYNAVKYFFEPDNQNIVTQIKMGIFHEYRNNKSLIRTIMTPTTYPLYRASKNWLQEADTIVCVSKRQAEIVKQQLPNAKIEVVYNPPPPVPPLEKKPSETPTLLYVGGDSYLKGFPIALWALSKLRHNYKAYITGHVAAKWANLVNKLGGKVTMLGRIPYSDVLKFHAQAWALLFPSIWEEPLPYAVVEALMTGTIPVAFAVGGVPEIVEGTAAKRFLCEPGNVECFIWRLEVIMSLEPNDITELKTNIQKSIQNKINIHDIKEKLIKIFSQ